MKSYDKQNFFDLISAEARQLIMDNAECSLDSNPLPRVQVL